MGFSTELTTERASATVATVADTLLTLTQRALAPTATKVALSTTRKRATTTSGATFRPANSRALPMTLTRTAVAETLLDMAAAVPSEAMATTWATAATAATEEATMEAALLLCSAVSTLQATKKKNQKLRP